MRWDGLFADLEAQSAALDTAERAAEVEERTRAEVGSLRWRDRLRAALGAPVRLRLCDGAAVAGRLERVGPDWLLVAEETGTEILVNAAAVLAVRDLGRLVAAPESGAVAARLGLRHALRGVARDRSVVRVHLLDGSSLDATIDRVGADFVEVAAHAAGEARRRRDVREVQLLPLAGLVAVRRLV